MSLSDNECLQAFAFIEQLLNDSGLRWVTSQVAEEIRFGKMTTRRVNAPLDVPEDIAIPALSDSHRRRVQIPATREHTPRERLEILCTAMEQAVIAPSEMQMAIRSRLDRVLPEWDGLRLVRTDAGERPDVEITRTLDEQNQDNVARLRELLNTLRGAI
ncbi:MAG: hypothetical protein P4M04_12885 [Acidobacteriota bacterium]|nr:hypothetical protein [Acidobacteriota bacterium]